MALSDKDTSSLTDREFLEALAWQLDKLTADTGKQLDHLDQMCHDIDRKVTEIGAFIDEHRPALARALGLLGGGLGAWRSRKRGADGAVPQDPRR